MSPGGPNSCDTVIECRAFHLAQLDREHLEKVYIVTRPSPALRRAYTSPRAT
jgi:hypothetical protein